MGHFEITPLTRPDCPGADFPFDEIIRRLGASAASPPSQPKAPPPPNAGPPFRVRVGSFPDRGGADAVRDRLRASGHGDAWTVQNGGIWQVQVISGPNLGKIEELAWALRKQGFEDVAVM